MKNAKVINNNVFCPICEAGSKEERTKIIDYCVASDGVKPYYEFIIVCKECGCESKYLLETDKTIRHSLDEIQIIERYGQ